MDYHLSHVCRLAKIWASVVPATQSSHVAEHVVGCVICGDVLAEQVAGEAAEVSAQADNLGADHAELGFAIGAL